MSEAAELTYLPYITAQTILLGVIAILFVAEIKFSWLFGDKKQHLNSDNQTKSDNNGEETEEQAGLLESIYEDDEDLDQKSKLIEPLHDPNTKMIPYTHKIYTEEEMLGRTIDFYNLMNNRRSIRFFSEQSVPEAIINNLIKTAGTSPSGAHTEPWTFVAIKNVDTKLQIRNVIEKQEEINYTARMGPQWTSDLQFVQTDWEKEYLSTAPWIIVVFRQTYFPLSNGKRRVHYYNEISTSISTGILLAAIQNAGLVTLTSTPLNCGPAIRTILNRPLHEKLLLLLPVGYPLESATVPDITRKELDDILIIA